MIHQEEKDSRPKKNTLARTSRVLFSHLDLPFLKDISRQWTKQEPEMPFLGEPRQAKDAQDEVAKGGRVFGTAHTKHPCRSQALF